VLSRLFAVTVIASLHRIQLLRDIFVSTLRYVHYGCVHLYPSSQLLCLLWLSGTGS